MSSCGNAALPHEVAQALSAALGSGPSTGVAINNPAANIGLLGNLSIRSLVSAGAGTLVAGVTVTDHERYVLIRGVGPSLGAFGISGFLRKPMLSVHGASGALIASTATHPPRPRWRLAAPTSATPIS